MVHVIERQNVYVECVSKRTGSLYLKRVQRRAVCVGVNLYEFRFNNMRMYARMIGNRLVCDGRMQAMSYPYRRVAA